MDEKQTFFFFFFNIRFYFVEEEAGIIWPRGFFFFDNFWHVEAIFPLVGLFSK